MKILKVDSGSYKIFIAGCGIKARQICQEWVTKGACVSVVDTDYIYKYGAERGVTVEFINYPRFPKEPHELLEDAVDLGFELCEGLFAGSYTVVGTGWTDTLYNVSIFHDRRD